LISPITVRSAEDAGITSHEWHLVAGHRRFIAVTENLGRDTIECIVVENCTDDRAKKINLTENLGREGLTPGQELNAILTVYGDDPDPEEVATDIGMGKAWVERRLAIRKLSQEAQDALNTGCLTSFDLSVLIECPLDNQQVLLKELLAAKEAGKSTSSVVAVRRRLRRTRTKGDIRKMMTTLLEREVTPTPWRTLAWAAGDLSDEELLNNE
jgi:ParB/RepB/Spo0J family partition protein